MSKSSLDRGIRAELIASLEKRTLFSAYTITAETSLPANTTAGSVVADTSGNLYGIEASGGVDAGALLFKYNIASKVVTPLYDFGTVGGDFGSLVIDPQGDIFGTAHFETSDSGSGFLFELPVNQTTITTVYTFTDIAIGQFPNAVVMDPNENLYVLTGYGGTNDGGTIVKFDATTHTPTLLASLTTTFQESPVGLTYSDGNLYGTVYGANTATNGGTLFELPEGQSEVTNLATFQSASDGSELDSAPYVAADGNVYGTAAGGGPDGGGEIWEYSPATQTLAGVAPFNIETDRNPNGNLVADSSGNLIGTTEDASSGNGAVFVFDPSSDALTFPDSFNGTDGSMPSAGLVDIGNDVFYGVTPSGGASNGGTVYQVALGSGGTTGGGGGTTGPGTVTPTIAKSTLPATVILGAKAKTASVSVTFTNTGAAPDASTTQLYASTDGAVDPSSVAIGKPSKKLTLKAGKTGKATITLPKLSLPAGTYSILAETTDSTGAVSVATGPAVAFVAPVISLSATLGAVSPTTVVAGKSISFTLTIANAGNIDSTGSATIAIGLSVDGATLSVPLKPQKKPVKVPAGGQAAPLKLHVAIPKAQAAGTFFPIVTFTQGTATLTAVGAVSFVIT